MNTKEIVNQAISYIMEHIEEEIALEDVAEYCHFSKFYFSRIFKDKTGESVYAFIKRMKLEQSAFRLKVEQERSVTEIGLDYGYCPSNYSQAFRRHLKESPMEFRSSIYDKSQNHLFYPGVEVKMDSFAKCNSKVKICTLNDIFVIYERVIGNYNNMSSTWCDFVGKYQAYQEKDSLMLERTFDDLSITDASKCLYDLCMSVSPDCPLENSYTIPGGRFAVYDFKGYPPQIYNAYQNIFNVWLPGSKYTVDKRYGFDIYRSIDFKTMYMELDICIPIES